MGTEFTEEHQALGAWSVDIDHNPVIVEELFKDNGEPRKNHFLLYDPDDILVYCGLSLTGVPSKEGVTIGGRDVGWWATCGLFTADYVSGTNKLSDGHFHHDLSEGVSDFWDLAENTKWVILGALEALYPPGNVAATFGAIEVDDVLRSAERFPTVPGRSYYVSAVIQLKGQLGPGLLRLRTVYTGRFINPNVASPYTSWSPAVRGDIHYETDPQGIVAGPVLRIQTALPNLIPNGSLDDGGGSLNGFIQFAGTWTLDSGGGHNGAHYVHTDAGPAWKSLISSADGAVVLPAAAQPVVPGERYQMWMVARTNPGSPATDGEAVMKAGITGLTASMLPTPTIRPDDGVGEWQLALLEFDIPDDMSALIPQIQVSGQTTGRWDFDDITLIRVKGNYDSVTGPQIFGTPGRTYRWTVPYRIDISVTDAVVQLRAVCRGPIYADPLIIDGPALTPNVDDPGLQQVSFDITLPSGYDNFIPQVYAADVHGGAYFLGEGTIVDTDTATQVFDVVSRPPDLSGYTTIAVASTAPAGSDSVHVEVIAEAESGQWIVGQVSIARTDKAPATGDDIVADILAALCLTAGDINCPEPIPYDWAPRNLTPLEALRHYCAVVSEPPREYRVNADGSVDVGTAEYLFPDHTPDGDDPIVLLSTDADVEPFDDIETDVTDRYTDIVVIGAERQMTSGRPPIIITASAPVPGAEDTDRNGNRIYRPKVVSDGTVDHWGYAQALANDLAEQEARPALALNVALTGRLEDGVVVVNHGAPPGDWLYAFEDGVLDDPTAEPADIEGDTVRPRRARVFTRTLAPGAGYRIVVERTNGTTFDLADKTRIIWPAAAVTALTVGDRLPEWVADPQGGAAGEQYIRDRASRPR